MTDLKQLTKGQRRVVEALLNANKSVPTYKSVAKKLSVSLGTVYTQLKRIREQHPVLYHDIMLERKRHLAKRHEQALERDAKHSKEYFRRRYNRQYKEKHGYYPWERYAHTGKW
jgi:transposase